MVRDILKRDLKRKKTMNIILLLFVILSTMFVASSVNNIITVATGTDYFFEKAELGDYMILTNGDYGRKDLKLEEKESVESYRQEDIIYASAEKIKFKGQKIEAKNVNILQSLEEWMKINSEAVYETILSIDGLAAAATDNASPFDFIKDPAALPDEQAEIVEMSKLIKQAIAKLPQKERTVVEYRFYRNMQAKDIATMVGLSPSRITRIVQFSLNQIREYLKSRGRVDY